MANLVFSAAHGSSRSARRFQISSSPARVRSRVESASGSRDIQLFTIPHTHHTVYLQQFVPSRFTNAWTAVAFALVASTILKGICDYSGTYLVNHAGFGMITDLRDDLYNAIIRRSSAFFSKHTTGTILSAIINDIERVQYAMSTSLRNSCSNSSPSSPSRE